MGILRTLLSYSKRELCVICGWRRVDGVDSFPVCSHCRPDLERDYDEEVDRQIKAYLEDLS